MNRLNDLVKQERRRRRRRTVLLCITALALGWVLGHTVWKDDHAAHSLSPVRMGAAGVLRLSPDRHREEPVRASRSRQAHGVQHQPDRGARQRLEPQRLPQGFEAWRRSWAALAVVRCESLRDHSYDHHYGTYRGFWQMDADFWRTYGGLVFASSPELASRADQDLVAYRGFLARGWQPWTCARNVGLI